MKGQGDPVEVKMAQEYKNLSQTELPHSTSQCLAFINNLLISLLQISLPPNMSTTFLLGVNFNLQKKKFFFLMWKQLYNMVTIHSL
jgi:hypothetical protein